jgi:anti-anti-sigma regulatory factor
LESYVELDALCSRPDSPQHSMVVLDMSGVVYMSEEAARKLNERRGDSLHIVNCSPFIEMLLGNTGNQ